MEVWEHIVVEPVFGWGATAALAVVVLASLWLTATTPGVSVLGRTVLVMIRLLAACILFLGWLRPAWIATVERETEGAIAVLLDTSQSMVLPSGQENASRWEAQRNLWQRIVSTTDLKIGGSIVVPYGFDTALHPVDPQDLPKLAEFYQRRPNGRRTDIARALMDLQQTQIDPPLQGAILVTDGVETASPPAGDATALARQLAQLNQPLVIVGLGPGADRSQTRDVAIESLPEHYTAFLNKELSVRCVLSAQGVQNQPIQVQLKSRRGSEPAQVRESRQEMVGRPQAKRPLEFSLTFPEPGEYVLEISASVEADEPVQSNNLGIAFVTVREGGARILYLEGEPRPEQLFVKRSLNESLDFDVDYLLFPPRDRRAGKWPVRLNRKVDLDQYDAFVIGDLDASALDDSSWQTIANRVRSGAGLMALGGYHSFDAGGYGRTPLAAAFPIELSRRSQPFDQPIDPSFHVQGEIQLIPRRPHPVTALAPEPENSLVWRRLKPLQGMNRLGRVLPNPGVQVLLESQRGEPVLVAGTYGDGRVLAMAGDTTWRWWMAGNKKEHQQFWRQAMLWLIRRDLVREGFRMTLQRRRWQIDDTPHVDIEWFPGTENKPLPEELEVVLWRDGERLHQLSTSRTDDNKLEAVVTGLDRVGLYEVRLSAQGNDGTNYETEVALIVQDYSPELEQPFADWQHLRNIAGANQSAGGTLVTPDEIDDALEFFRKRQEQTKVEVVEKRQLGDHAVDAWVYLVLFSAVMTLEWGLRKRWQLP